MNRALVPCVASVVAAEKAAAFLEVVWLVKIAVLIKLFLQERESRPT